MAVCRGIVYHRLRDDLKFLLFSLFKKINEKKIIKKFEKRFKVFNESNYCLSFPFARTAFYYIVKSLNLKKGDEVIISPIQIKPMLEIILHFNLKPIVVDINQNDLNFNLKTFKQKINKKTKLVLITYLYGIVPNIVQIKKLIPKNIIIVEDFSQCLGGKFKNINVGNFGDYGIYSMSATKTLDCYGGATVVTNSFEKYNLLKKHIFNLANPSRFFLVKKILVSLMRNFFSKKLVFSIFTINTLRLMHILGFSFFTRFVGTRDLKLKYKKLPHLWFQEITSVQAEAGLQFLKNVKKNDKIRINNVKKIRKFIGKKFFPQDNQESHNVYWQLPFIHAKSKIIQNKLLFKGIDLASPSITLISDALSEKKIFAKYIYKNCIFIPCYHSLKDQDLHLMEKNLSKYV